MVTALHHVVFRFQLPPVLLLHVQSGLWPLAPRGSTVEVTAAGEVTVTSFDHSERYGRDQVLRLTVAFLRSSVREAPPLSVPGVLCAPSCRERPEQHVITLGAKVSISPTRWAPVTETDALSLTPPRRGYRGLHLASG